MSEETRELSSEPAGRRLTGVALLGAVLVAAVMAGYLMFRPSDGDDGTYDLADLPVIAPDPGEERIRPLEEGGKDIPHRDVTVFSRMRAAGDADTAEQLLPHPERPLQALPHERAEAAETAARAFHPLPQGEEQLLPVQRGPDTDAVAAPPTRSIADLVREEGLAERPATEMTETADAASPGVPTPRPRPEQLAAARPAAEPRPGGTDLSRSFRVQLAAARAEDGARAEWERLRTTHRELLGDLRSQVVRSDLGERGVFYRLQAGPLDGRDGAERLCAALRDRNVGCFIVAP